MKKRIQIDTTLLVLIILFTGFLYLNRRIYLSPWGVFTSRAHPEERSDEGSQEILPRFARQDEGSNVEKTPRPLIYFISPGVDNVLDFFGMIVILKGVLLRMSARGHKKAHSREGDRLVETGPYVLTRNPMYLGSFLIGVGFALIVWPWWSWPVFAVFFYMRFIVQITREEKHLARLFPNDFTAYCQRAPRLLPSISSALKARPRDIFKIDEAWSTKEKWGLLAWPLLAVALEWLQESLVFGAAQPVTILVVFIAAGVVLIMGLWVAYQYGSRE
ncbi:MAG TPA: hypothetical protein DE315_05665 [Candidatus Omnitrophica bacterium]|nr:hypothetical protein [Candidatus Omnitrophota bacterium]